MASAISNHGTNPASEEKAATAWRGAALSCLDIRKSYIREPGERLDVLRGISLDVKAGSFVCIVGPSGCGKTTLLRIAAGITKPDSGSVTVDGSPVYQAGRDVAMVYQNYGLFPWQTVARNVALGLRLRHEKDIEAKIEPILATVGLERHRNHYPHELSGGQQQRVSLARALAVEPAILLMDEPFAAVDALTREQLQNMVLEIWRARGMTVVFITHDIGEAVYLSDRVVVMGTGGKVTRDVPVLTARPRTLDSRTSAESVAAEKEIRAFLRLEP